MPVERLNWRRRKKFSRQLDKKIKRDIKPGQEDSLSVPQNPINKPLENEKTHQPKDSPEKIYPKNTEPNLNEE